MGNLVPRLIGDAIALLQKAQRGDIRPGHKYHSRRRDKDTGDWIYDYGDQGPHHPHGGDQPRVVEPQPATISPDLGPTFYATIDSDSIRDYMPAVPCLFPVSSWVRKAKKDDRGMVIGDIPAPKLPAHVASSDIEKGVDGGGFVAARFWGGEYHFTHAQYVKWIDKIKPTWAAMLDYCVEPAIAGTPAAVRSRQEKTTANAHELWATYKDEPFAWVPTIQGWNIEDYLQHAKDMEPLIREMHASYAARGMADAFRVGVGTLCCRTSRDQILAIVHAVADALPGVPLHLWGVKLDALKASEALPPAVKSTDSAAWNGRFGTDIEAYEESGLSQREHAYTVALPNYQAKIEAAGAAPKQTRTATDAAVDWGKLAPPKVQTEPILIDCPQCGPLNSDEWDEDEDSDIRETIALGLCPICHSPLMENEIAPKKKVKRPKPAHIYLTDAYRDKVLTIEQSDQFLRDVLAKQTRMELSWDDPTLVKAHKGEQIAGHAYLRREALPAGGFKYIYHDDFKPEKKVEAPPFTFELGKKNELIISSSDKRIADPAPALIAEARIALGLAGKAPDFNHDPKDPAYWGVILAERVADPRNIREWGDPIVNRMYDLMGQATQAGLADDDDAWEDVKIVATQVAEKLHRIAAPGPGENSRSAKREARTFAKVFYSQHPATAAYKPDARDVSRDSRIAAADIHSGMLRLRTMRASKNEPMTEGQLLAVADSMKASFDRLRTLAKTNPALLDQPMAGYDHLLGLDDTPVGMDASDPPQMRALYQYIKSAAHPSMAGAASVIAGKTVTSAVAINRAWKVPSDLGFSSVWDYAYQVMAKEAQRADPIGGRAAPMPAPAAPQQPVAAAPAPAPVAAPARPVVAPARAPALKRTPKVKAPAPEHPYARPWEMTRQQWNVAKEENQVSGYGLRNYTRGSGSHEIARIGNIQQLAGDYKRLDHAQPAVSHREVVRAALAAGRDVPPHVLADYPDLGGSANVSAAEHSAQQQQHVLSRLATGRESAAERAPVIDAPPAVALNDKVSRAHVLAHIMSTNPPAQVKEGRMSPDEWANQYLSNEPNGYTLMHVDPKAMHFPAAPDMGKVASFAEKPTGDAPPIVVDSNQKIRAQSGSGVHDHVGDDLQPHTVIDGKHRTMAAAIRGDRAIPAFVPSHLAAQLRRESDRAAAPAPAASARPALVVGAKAQAAFGVPAPKAEKRKPKIPTPAPGGQLDLFGASSGAEQLRMEFSRRATTVALVLRRTED